MRLKGEQLAKNIEDVKAGSLVVDREMDELTLALGNPQHPGHVHGFGIVPWKYDFKKKRDLYRSRKRRKDRAEQSWRRNLESQVQSVEQRIHDEQQFAVDFIRQRNSCELHVPVGNLTIQVVYASALPSWATQASHGMEIPPGYASVSVEQLIDSQYEGYELQLPGGVRERTLGDAIQGGIILWRKRYIIILGMEAVPLPEEPEPQPSPQMARPTSPPRPELVGSLSPKMYEFHEWYMKTSADQTSMFGLKVKLIDFYDEGEKCL
uniref:DUF8039 domain-containing protein n=1 Tax=Setaria viridis TaxID=4556 RepID=A0A4U6U252_SETVI|nr:hypothetical protein SEVIR_6G112400v2 [Setaria viridis]